MKHLPAGEIMTYANLNGNKIQIRSKAVVILNGGKPSIPRDIFNNVANEKLITADYMLRRKGYETFMENLTKNPTKRKIVIIGGSHSGFSCAWMLVNGPAVYNHNKNGCKLVFDKPPSGNVYKCKNPNDCQSAILDSYTKSDAKSTPTECHCFGAFDTDDMWGFKKPKDFPKFEKNQITILYKDRIKIFYSKVSKAIEDGYTDYKQH